MSEQLEIVSSPTNDWKKEWVGMPEYNNVVIEDPEIVVTIKFRNNEDFEDFKNKAQEYLFDGEKPFDGMQRKTVKNTWYPHKTKANKYRYINET